MFFWGVVRAFERVPPPSPRQTACCVRKEPQRALFRQKPPLFLVTLGSRIIPPNNLRRLRPLDRTLKSSAAEEATADISLMSSPSLACASAGGSPRQQCIQCRRRLCDFLVYLGLCSDSKARLSISSWFECSELAIGSRPDGLTLRQEYLWFASLREVSIGRSGAGP